MIPHAMQMSAAIFSILWLFVNFTQAQPAPTQEEIKLFNESFTTYQKYLKQGDYENALPHIKLAYELGQKMFTTNDKNLAALTYNYGFTLGNTNEIDLAADVLRVALSRYETVFGKAAVELVQPLMEQAHVDAKLQIASRGKRQRRTAMYKIYFNRALKIAEQTSDDPLLYARLSREAGISIFETFESDDARPYLKEAHEIYLERLGSKDAMTALTSYWLARVENSNKDYKTAETYLLSALDSFAAPEIPANDFEIATHVLLVEVYEKQGERDKATTHCQAIGRIKQWQAGPMQTPVYQTIPVYPREARSANIGGTIVLGFSVSEAGIVQDPKITTSSGNQFLDDAAIASVMEWRYAPKFENDVPVAADSSTELIFNAKK